MKNVVESAIEQAIQPSVQVIEGVPFAFVPAAVERVDLGKLCPRPRRLMGNRRFHDCASFCLYVNDFVGIEGTRIYADIDAPAGGAGFLAVFNDHEPALAGAHTEGAGWGDFTAAYVPRHSPEWKTWTSNSGKSMPQFEFAQFLEDNLNDITAHDNSPSGGQMLAMALSLESNRDNRFKSAIRLEDGSVDMLLKENDTTIQKMKVFSRFHVGIAPIEGAQPYRVPARLRYRVRDGSLTFWYDLLRPDLVYADALNDIVTQIKTATGKEVLRAEVK